MKRSVFLIRMILIAVAAVLLFLGLASFGCFGALTGLADGKLLTLVLTAAALGADAMSLSVGIGLRGFTGREAVKASLVIGAFHVFMPLLGMAGGAYFSRRAGGIAQVVGAAIVAIIGIRMVVGCLKCQGRGDEGNQWALGGFSLLLLAFCVSIDAFSIGLGLGALGFNAYFASVIFGLFGAAMTLAGLYLGRKMCTFVGQYGELAGGAVLIALSVKMFLEG